MKQLQDLRILVVTGDRKCRQSLHCSLSALGVERIVHAEHGLMGYYTFQQDGPFDLVIAEFDLEDLSGLELTILVRDDPTWPDTPVVMVSSERKEIHGLPREVGAVTCLQKPVAQKELEQVLNRLLLQAAPTV